MRGDMQLSWFSMLGREINILKNILLLECSTKEPEDTDDYGKNLGTKMNKVFNLAQLANFCKKFAIKMSALICVYF
jgi:hypothetical protein